MTPLDSGWSPQPMYKYDYISYAKSQVGPAEWICLEELWERESSWTTRDKPWTAVNRSSGAYGIPQSLPAKKMETAGHDWRTNPMTQIKWGLQYIHDRYGSVCKALQHHNRKGWY
jgi:hypothetical protein